MRKLFTPIALAAFITTLAGATQAAPAEDLQTIINEHWAWHLEQSPTSRTHQGDNSANDRWPDMSLAAHRQRYQARGEFLQRLAALQESELDAEAQLNRALLQQQLQRKRREHELGLDLMKVNMRTGPQHRHTILGYTPTGTEQDLEMWLARMQGLPTLLAQHRELLQEGIRRQRVQALVVMERVPGQIDRVVAGKPEDSPFYKPFRQRPEGVDAASFQRLQARAAQVIEQDINPAYRAFKQFLQEQYLPACREQPGIGSLPEGKALYDFLAQRFTTTDLSPQAIHDIGKGEVARILAEMEEVKAEAGFNGSLQDFNEFLRTDPQFYYDSPEALFEAYLALSKRLDPELVSLFGRLPRMPYGVRPIPEQLAPDTTTAYYQRPALDGSRAGYYYVNLYRPEVRPKYEMEVLSVHEAVPGHHLQLALAQEIEGLPKFRSSAGATAFIEGWALYSERLGYQMGLYQDPYSRYGQLTYDMWRAVRLVVDTGIHYLGWSRQQAIDYFKAHAGKTEADIINEIDRYIGWPGQALAYKIGQLKILELRAYAEAELGDDFDIRAFHDELLGAGAIPLQLLEQRMRQWVAAQER